ncbi:hypothetical protein HGG73_07570 [Rhodobacteraceae bacterium R_SAG3]|uniref:hypothetical protein n=1 Tax=Tritonibacter mobilis TaxID=379347 RepID=UPI000806E81D|nr:hypothetical protein [Tritonibacter mobilis]NKX74015.1 hypothetical protein [Rhodobacteraceae bacterium R_SAG3]
MIDATIAETEPVLVAVPGRKRRRRLTVLNKFEDFDRLLATMATLYARLLKQRAIINAPLVTSFGSG